MTTKPSANAQARARNRAQVKLNATLAPGLPIGAQASAILAALKAHPVTIVCGATGSGKTTQLPKLCVQAGLGLAGMIGHTQPRRLAARSVAQRIADETGVVLGDGVGYRVRFADRTSGHCRIKLMTDGILLQELKRDRLLRRYDCLIIDEAHERSLNIDFILGYLKRVLKQRTDLKVIVTSATIDPQRFAQFFDTAPVIEVSGRSYPIDLRYAPDESQPLPQQVCDAVLPLLRTGDATSGDILVFLPGERDIHECERLLKQAGAGRSAQVLPLFARLNVAAQQKIFTPAAKRRVILATNIAETSLTVPRIRYVVDSGLARIGRYSHRSKLQRLPVEPVSRASADQRAGRCGRLGPGICIRLYSEQDYEQRPAFEEPQIQRSNLAGVMLQMAHLGLGRIEDFDFMEPPDTRLIRDGYTVLRELNAMDADDRITPLGKRMAQLPVEPRLSRALLAGSDLGCLEEALIIVSGLSVPDPREKRAGNAQGGQAGQPEQDEVTDPRSDWMTLLNIWRAFVQIKGEGARWRWCKAAGISRPRMDEWRDVHRQLGALSRDHRLTLNQRPADYAAIHRALLFGFVSHLGQRDSGRNYHGARGRQFAIFPGSVVAAKPPPWVVATELIETSQVFAHQVAAVKAGWIQAAAEHLLKRDYLEPQWSDGRGQATVIEQASVFGLVLSSRKRVPLAPIDAATAHRLLIDHLLVAPATPLALPFAEHNAALRAEAAQWEARLRRIVVDDATLAAFFAERLPATVTDRKRFLAWYEQRDAHNDERLRLSLEDLGITRTAAAAWYPLHLTVSGNQLPLTYEFAPGTARDGVTLALPLALTGHVSAAQLDWLIPGWLEEKTLLLLRALPKAQRKRLAPIAATAQRFVAWAIAAQLPGGSDSLVDVLARYLRDTLRLQVDTRALASVTLPAHLQMRVELHGADNRVVASGRDYAQLVKDHAGTSAVAQPRPGHWHRDQLTTWDFGDLPDAVEVEQQGVRIGGCPGLAEENAQVILRVYPDLDSARRQHKTGVVRLAMGQLRDKIKYLRKQLPDINRLSLLFLQLGEVDDLLDDLVFASLRDDAPVAPVTVRTADAFRTFVEDARQHLIARVQARAALALEILTARQAIATRLDGDAPADAVAVADIHSQLTHLVPANFVRTTPAAWLAHLPRFLAAIERRLQRLAERGAENPQHQAAVKRLWQRYLAIDDLAQREALTDYRWLLEEYRVSVFSQPLKTSCRVSAKRLDSAWQSACQ